MSTLIVYASKHGSAEKCAKNIAEKLGDSTTIYNLLKKNNIDLTQYDRVIVGGSIYVGQIQKEVKSFCTENLEQLKSKKLGLFITCMDEGETAQTHIKNAYPEELISVATIVESCGGEFNFSKMNFFERTIIKMVSKSKNDGKPVDTKKDISKLSHENINKIAQAML